MVDLNKLTPEALKAAMKGGTSGWGVMASAIHHVRYMQPAPKQARSKCPCGCGQRATHLCMANGMVLGRGCEMAVSRWVRGHEPRKAKTPRDHPAGGAS